MEGDFFHQQWRFKYPCLEQLHEKMRNQISQKLRWKQQNESHEGDINKFKLNENFLHLEIFVPAQN